MANQEDRNFLLKYCNIMASKLKCPQDRELIQLWLKRVGEPGESEGDDSSGENECSRLAYLQLILWALHTGRIHVAPLCLPPPTRLPCVNQAYELALNMVRLEPKLNEKRGDEVRALVSQDLTEYLAVQGSCDNEGWGTHAYYGFADKNPLPTWTMPPSQKGRQLQSQLEGDAEYWTKVFSRQACTSAPIGQELTNNPECENEEKAETREDDVENNVKVRQSKEADTACLNLNKIQSILNNLSFGDKEPQDLSTLVYCNNEHADDDEAAEENEESEITEDVMVDSYPLVIDSDNNVFRNEQKSKCPKRPPREQTVKKRTLWDGYDLNSASCPDDSLLALYSTSFFEQNNKANSRHHCKVDKKVSECRKPCSASHNNRSLKDIGCSVPKYYPKQKPNRKWTMRESELRDDLNQINRRKKTNGELENSPYRSRKQASEVCRGKSRPDNRWACHAERTNHEWPESSPTTEGRRGLRCSEASEPRRRLQFSQVLMEPESLHSPRLAPATPLKPCLRKVSDDSPSTDVSESASQCFQQRERRLKRDPPSCYYASPPHRSRPSTYPHPFRK